MQVRSVRRPQHAIANAGRSIMYAYAMPNDYYGSYSALYQSCTTSDSLAIGAPLVHDRIKTVAVPDVDVK